MMQSPNRIDPVASVDLDARKIMVLVDDRERRSAVRAALQRSSRLLVREQRLTVGDYEVDSRFLFERKTLPDLVASIQSGRLFRQCLRLARVQALQPALVLEGTGRDLEGSGMGWEQIQGALLTVALFIGLPVLRTRSAEETVRTFLYAARQGRTVAVDALPRRGRRPHGKAAVQRYLLQGLPGVGPRRAARLLDRFGSVQEVVSAREEHLAEVPGLGTRLARRIRWAVREGGARYRAPACAADGTPPDGCRRG